MEKRKKIAPILFLISLFSIVIFVIGVSYGRTIAKIDIETISRISITPTPMVSVSDTPNQAAYQAENEFKDCSVGFLYPFSYKTVKIATISGEIFSSKNRTISIICNTTLVNEILTQESATSSGKILINKGTINRFKLKERIWLEVKKNNSKSSTLISISPEIDKLVTRTLIVN